MMKSFWSAWAKPRSPMLSARMIRKNIMTRSWKYTAGLFVISYWLLVTPAFALPEIKPTFPRLANYFLHWTVSEQEARELAKFDLVILDAEAQERSQPQLELIRKLNPRIILLAYVPASEIRRGVST